MCRFLALSPRYAQPHQCPVQGRGFVPLCLCDLAVVLCRDLNQSPGIAYVDGHLTSRSDSPQVFRAHHRAHARAPRRIPDGAHYVGEDDLFSPSRTDRSNLYVLVAQLCPYRIQCLRKAQFLEMARLPELDLPIVNPEVRGVDCAAGDEKVVGSRKAELGSEDPPELESPRFPDSGDFAEILNLDVAMRRVPVNSPAPKTGDSPARAGPVPP